LSEVRAQYFRCALPNFEGRNRPKNTDKRPWGEGEWKLNPPPTWL
jgi:hypothetical protein